MTEEIKELFKLLYADNLSVGGKRKLEKYITNLQQENEKLKYNARGQVNDYFKDKYADEVLKNAELTKENEKEKQFIKDCGFQNQQQLVLAYLDYKSRFEKTIEYIDEHTLFVNGGIIKSILNGSDENETNS